MKMGTTIRILLVFLLAAMMPQVSEAKALYVGIAGPNAGPGLMGHSFLVVAEQPKRFLDARYYQYAFSTAQHLPKSLDAQEWLSLKEIPFRLETGMAWDFIQSYLREDRAVRLFEMRLTDEQIDRIERAAEADRLLRHAVMQFDYSLFSNNCETKILDLLNSVLPEENRFSYIPFSQQGFVAGLMHDPAKTAVTIPIGVAPVLERHPLVVGRFTFHPRNYTQVERALRGFEVLLPLFKICGTSNPKQSVLLELFGPSDLRHSKKYLDVLENVLGSCARREGLGAQFNLHIDFLRSDTSDPGFLSESALRFIR